MKFGKNLVFLLMLSVSGAVASGSPLGTGEELVKSRNCPDGIAISRLNSSREIKIEEVGPGKFIRLLFTAEPASYSRCIE